MSAGILLYREGPGGIEVFLGKMGGPFWTRHPRAWSIPKGEHTAQEPPLDAALREFAEEIGTSAPTVEYTLLGVFRQNPHKALTVYSGMGDEQVRFITSNTFELEWPRRSGVIRSYPELETACWFPLDEGREQVVAGQMAALDTLSRLVQDL
ncbi:NUDIX domain-containing protein [Rathayibacter toxicus]|nr:NUDIX domain-containing protein [Rathayibacter toxicus]